MQTRNTCIRTEIKLIFPQRRVSDYKGNLTYIVELVNINMPRSYCAGEQPLFTAYILTKQIDITKLISLMLKMERENFDDCPSANSIN